MLVYRTVTVVHFLFDAAYRTSRHQSSILAVVATYNTAVLAVELRRVQTLKGLLEPVLLSYQPTRIIPGSGYVTCDPHDLEI